MTYPDTLLVIVKQEHIDKGAAKDCTKCPIALAITESYPELGEVRVFLNYFAFDVHLKGSNERTYDLPEVAENFIALFDSHEHENHPFYFVATHEE